MTNDEIIRSLVCLAVGFIGGYIVSVLINKFRWSVKPFAVVVGIALWILATVARIVNPDINLGVVFDITVGAVIGNAVGFNFGNLLGRKVVEEIVTTDTHTTTTKTNDTNNETKA